jgi:tetraacyldisaccharide-1-P 4'-kinase
MSEERVEHLALLEVGSLSRLLGAQAEAVRMAQTAAGAEAVGQEPLELLATIPQAATVVTQMSKARHKATH